jgi:hypothetical protein
MSDQRRNHIKRSRLDLDKVKIKGQKFDIQPLCLSTALRLNVHPGIQIDTDQLEGFPESSCDREIMTAVPAPQAQYPRIFPAIGSGNDFVVE